MSREYSRINKILKLRGFCLDSFSASDSDLLSSALASDIILLMNYQFAITRVVRPR